MVNHDEHEEYDEKRWLIVVFLVASWIIRRTKSVRTLDSRTAASRRHRRRAATEAGAIIRPDQRGDELKRLVPLR
jgi:hypothetical protein